jgi:hypothetical protein
MFCHWQPDWRFPPLPYVELQPQLKDLRAVPGPMLRSHTPRPAGTTSGIAISGDLATSALLASGILEAKPSHFATTVASHTSTLVAFTASYPTR